jgi:hypothetical protein
MQMQWMKDVDRALAGGRAQQKHVLLDFSAAPM